MPDGQWLLNGYRYYAANGIRYYPLIGINGTAGNPYTPNVCISAPCNGTIDAIWTRHEGVETTRQIDTRICINGTIGSDVVNDAGNWGIGDIYFRKSCGSKAFSQGDTLCVSTSIPSDYTPVPDTHYRRWYIHIDCDDSFIVFGHFYRPHYTTSPRYANIPGNAWSTQATSHCSTVTNSRNLIMPVGCTLKNMFTRYTAALTSTQTAQITLYKNGSPTSLYTSITGDGSTSVSSNTTDTVSFNIGDIFTLRLDHNTHCSQIDWASVSFEMYQPRDHTSSRPAGVVFGGKEGDLYNTFLGCHRTFTWGNAESSTPPIENAALGVTYSALHFYSNKKPTEGHLRWRLETYEVDGSPTTVIVAASTITPDSPSSMTSLIGDYTVDFDMYSSNYPGNRGVSGAHIYMTGSPTGTYGSWSYVIGSMDTGIYTLNADLGVTHNAETCSLYANYESSFLHVFSGSETILITAGQEISTNHICLNDNIAVEGILENLGSEPVPTTGVYVYVEDEVGMWRQALTLLDAEWEDPANEFNKTPQFKAKIHDETGEESGD